MRDSLDNRNAHSDSSVRLAVLRTQGCHFENDLLDPATCGQIVHDLRRCVESARAVVSEPIRVGRILEQSDAALALLNDAALAALVGEVVGDDAILSRFESADSSIPEWTRDFGRILQTVPSRQFRPGVVVFIPLVETQFQILAASQRLDAESGIDASKFQLITHDASPGSLVVLEGGVCYRIPQRSAHLQLKFIRPWLKPEVLYAAALCRERFELLGERARQWCGSELGLPTSVEEFLRIEQAALDGVVGRAKGSGI